MGVTRGVLRTLRSAAGSESQRVIFECRRCGRTLDDDGASCPSCGADDVARFSF